MEEKQISLEQDSNNVVLTVARSQKIIRRLSALVQSLRPRQWTKNSALFIALVFAQQLLVGPSFVRACLGCITFCLASSVTYLLNDILDLEKDRQHPVKRDRPIASGRLPVPWATSAMSSLLFSCCALLAILFFLPIKDHDIFTPFGGSNFIFTSIVFLYLVSMAGYSLYLKHVVLVDIFIIAFGFVLRILASAVVIAVYISPWLILVTCFLSLFLALCKRRHEVILLQQNAEHHRQILKEYGLPLLDQLITITVTCTIVSYSLYTIESPTGNHHLIVTIPFVLFGMFRYLYLVYMKMEGGSPEEILLRDPPMIGTVLLCTTFIIYGLYIWP